MRNKPGKSNSGKVAAVLIVLALIWLIVGTLIILKVKDTIVNGTYESNGGGDAIQQEEDDEDYDSGFDDLDEDGVTDDDEDDGIDDLDDEGFDDEDDGVADDDSAGVGSSDQDDVDDDDDDGADDVNEDDDGDTDDDVDDDAQTFTVDAWDGFAAVRTGRGTGYSEVGRLNNGETVKVTDLENGWYKIVAGKWKGYYLHKSSLK